MTATPAEADLEESAAAAEAAAADPLSEAPALAATLDNPLPAAPELEDRPAAPAQADEPAAPAPENQPAAPAPADEPAAPALEDQPAAPAPQEDTAPEAPEPQIIAISETTSGPDLIADDPATAAEATIVQAGFSVPLPESPAEPTDPAGPAEPVLVETDVIAAEGASTTSPATGDTTVVAAEQIGVPHLPSPDNLPPGTSDEPIGPASNPNVSYLKELWGALKNQEIDRNDLLVALAQRSFTAPVPGDAVTLAPGPAAAPTEG